jgi:geranylgeranyl diphosphate synthase, type I
MSDMGSSLQRFSKLHAPQIHQEIVHFFAEKKETVSVQSPHIARSISYLEEFCLRGGKAIRPLLVILAFRLAGGTGEEAYKVAAAVELFHKQLLGLDDVADRDEVRNGGPTLWKKYQDFFVEAKWADAQHHGRTFAEIDITLLESFGYELIRTADISAEQKLQILSVINNLTFGATIIGWQISYVMNHDALADANEAEFLKGLEYVTAKYTFEAPLLIGLSAAVENPHFYQLKSALTEYALRVGLAFQIQDDILGLFGDPAEMGKAVGNDVREGKKTLLLQKAFQEGSEADKKFLTDVCGRELNPGELEKIQKIVRDTGSLEYSQKLAKKSVEGGIAALATLEDQNHSEEVQVLKELAEFVISRQV